MKWILFFTTLLSLNALAYDALVWGGPGACKDGCVDAAVQVTKMAGFDPMIVTPENFDASLFENAKVWVQPGGKSATASQYIGKAGRKVIKEFIAQGGGYVGFCAGAFMTTAMVGRTDTPGLGIIPGQTKPWRKNRGNPSTEKIILPDGSTKYHYWEGGPYFIISAKSQKNLTITSRYNTNKAINGVEAKYGLGRVAVTGTHPEAPQWWYEDMRFTDPDGIDNEEAAQMIRWAAQR